MCWHLIPFTHDVPSNTRCTADGYIEQSALVAKVVPYLGQLQEIGVFEYVLLSFLWVYCGHTVLLYQHTWVAFFFWDLHGFVSRARWKAKAKEWLHQCLALCFPAFVARLHLCGSLCGSHRGLFLKPLATVQKSHEGSYFLVGWLWCESVRLKQKLQPATFTFRGILFSEGFLGRVFGVMYCGCSGWPCVAIA